MGKLKTVFLGTPEFAVPVLHRLARETEIALVITQPDRPAGRGRKLTSPPVKIAARELGIEVIQPEIVKGRRFADRVSKYRPDFLVTAAFGRILGPSLLAVPSLASLNVHASLLPLHRGAAPANWAILSGDQETGVSIMRMEPGLDTGPVYAMERIRIGENETAGELLGRLATLGAAALAETLQRFEGIEPVAQEHDRATWAPVLKKTDGQLDWTRSAEENHCHIRGMHPWPVASASLDGDVLRIHRALVLEKEGVSDTPGEILSISTEGIDVSCGKGSLRLTEVQSSGRKRLHVSDFVKGASLRAGQIFSAKRAIENT